MYKINPILVSTTKKTNQFHSSQQQEFIGQKAYAFLHSYQIHFNVDFQIEMKDEILFFRFHYISFSSQMLKVNDIIDKYKIICLVGRGSFGCAYKAINIYDDVSLFSYKNSMK